MQGIDLRQYYVPTDRQLEFWKSKAKYKLYGGAMGGGKSRTICEVALQLLLTYPGNKCLIMRRTLADLKLSTMKTFFDQTALKDRKVFEALVKGEFHRTENRLTFINGSMVYFTGVDDTNFNKVKSTEWGLICMDEASEIPASVFDMLITRLRHILPDGSRPPYQILLASNPEPGWVKRRFVDMDVKHPEKYSFTPALPNDNPHLPDEYVEGFDELPEIMQKKYRDGDWDVFDGQVYEEFQRDVHVLKDISWKPPDDWERYAGLDHGMTNPTALVYIAVEPSDGTVYVYDEYYEKGKVVSDHAEAIKKKDPVQLIIADPSIRNRNPETGRSVHQIYSDHGVHLTLGNNDIIAGIMRVKEYLKVREVVDEQTGEKKKFAKMYISPRCINFIRELADYKWARSKDGEDAPERPVKAADHLLDSVRYLLMKLPWELGYSGTGAFNPIIEDFESDQEGPSGSFFDS